MVSRYPQKYFYKITETCTRCCTSAKKLVAFVDVWFAFVDGTVRLVRSSSLLLGGGAADDLLHFRIHLCYCHTGENVHEISRNYA